MTRENKTHTASITVHVGALGRRQLHVGHPLSSCQELIFSQHQCGVRSGSNIRAKQQHTAHETHTRERSTLRHFKHPSRPPSYPLPRGATMSPSVNIDGVYILILIDAHTTHVTYSTYNGTHIREWLTQGNFMQATSLNSIYHEVFFSQHRWGLLTGSNLRAYSNIQRIQRIQHIPGSA